jgi:hypothetical protein
MILASADWNRAFRPAHCASHAIAHVQVVNSSTPALSRRARHAQEDCATCPPPGPIEPADRTAFALIASSRPATRTPPRHAARRARSRPGRCNSRGRGWAYAPVEPPGALSQPPYGCSASACGSSSPRSDGRGRSSNGRQAAPVRTRVVLDPAGSEAGGGEFGRVRLNVTRLDRGELRERRSE